MKRKKLHEPKSRRKTTASAPRHPARAEPISVNMLRIIACGVIFTVLIMLKLLTPGGLASLRGTLASWLVRDADFAAAFSAVGHAVSGEGGMLDSLGDAYLAVFQPQEAAEVSGPAEVSQDSPETAEQGTAETPQPEQPPAYPEHAAAEQRVLGFAYMPPLQGTLTSGFGWREHPVDGRETFHYGVDLAAEEGTAITSFADGRVGVVAESVELGKYLTVHHENGIITLYGHCSRITASPGADVRCGDKLAEAGSTGNATGTHLHFEIQDGEDYLNPIYYLS